MDRWLWQTVLSVFRPSVRALGVAVLLCTPPLSGAKPPNAASDPSSEAAFLSVREKGSPVFADPYPSPPSPPPADLLFSVKAATRAEALALYAVAALTEESDGPSKASALYQAALDRDPANAALAVRLAGEFLASEKPSEALRLLKDTHAFAPDQPAPLVELARIYLTILRRPDGALAYAEKAYKLAPESIPVLGTYIDTCAAAQLAQRVEDALKRVLLGNSPSPDYWLQVGTLFRNALTQRNASARASLGRVQELFQKALSLAPDNPLVLEAVSDHYALTQQLPEALALYRRAHEAHRKKHNTFSTPICLKWARVLLMAEQVAPAMRLLEELLGADPTVNDARELLGELHLQQGELLPALTQFRLALQGASSQPEDYLRVAQIQLRLKRPADAVTTARQGRTHFPDFPQLSLLTAIALVETKQHAEALRCFEEAERQFLQTQKNALDAGFYLSYGAAAERAGLPERAASLLKKSIDLDPENAAEALNYLGFLWVDRNENLDQAGDMIQRALRMKPDHPAYLDSLGWWHFRKGEYEAALRAIQKALEQIAREDASEVYDHLGDVLEKLSRKEEALEAWKNARELNPELPEVWNKIKKARDNP